MVYGMKEKKGIPINLCGLKVTDADATVGSMTNRIRDGIKPRIPGLYVRAVKLNKSNVAIVIRVPKSFASPHMVTYKGTSRFFARTSNGKYQLDVHEIRAAFLLSETIAERIREFRAERIARIQADETPVPLYKHAKIVAHMIPLNAFSITTRLNLSPLRNLYQSMKLFPILHHNASRSRHNLEGFLTNEWGQGNPCAAAYLQIYRNGIFKSVDSSYLAPYNGNIYIPSRAFEDDLLESVGNYLSALKQLEVEPPIVLMLSLLNVSGCKIGYDRTPLNIPNCIDRDTILTPALLVESFDFDPSTGMKPIFDVVWNAAGWPSSMNYDEEGKRKSS